MSSLRNDILVSPQDLFTQLSPTATTGPYQAYLPELGARAVTGDGREFRLASAGGTTLVNGTLQQSAAVVANHQNLTTATAAVGATQITVTLGATAATANQYSGGYVTINAGTGIGQTLQIASHPAADASATLVLTLADALVEATAVADSKACLFPNLYSAVIQCPTTRTGAPVGVPLINITTHYYGWLQVWGVVGCLNEGGTAVGLGLAPSGTTAGALATVAATTNQVASAMQAGVTTESRFVFLTIG